MAKESKSDTQMGWIYEGTKALVNREDYLLGKRLDKNFEMYSDAVVKEKEEGMDTLVEARSRPSQQSSSKVSNLGTNIVRNEDPLVAIKMKEDRLRREKLENPLVMLKLQKVVKEAMEKQARKLIKKDKKEKKSKRKKRESTSSSDSDAKHRHRKDSSSHSHKRHHKYHSRSSSREQKRRRHSSTADSEMKSDDRRKNRHATKDDSEDEVDKSRRRSSTSSNSHDKRKAQESSAKRSSQRDSHIPEHLRPKHDAASSSSDSDSHNKSNDDEKQKKSRFKGYGLVGVKKNEKEADSKAKNPYELARFKPTVQPYKKEDRRKLTKEEMDAKRREMQDNAKWRDSTRSKNVANAKRADEREKEKEKNKVADFIRPMLNSAASSLTVEQQLSSHRQGLQRSHGYMEKKFANR